MQITKKAAKAQNKILSPCSPGAGASHPGHFIAPPAAEKEIPLKRDPVKLVAPAAAPPRVDPVIQAWGAYLDAREWQLWTTLTTCRELTLAGARRSVNKLSTYLKETGYPAELFWAAEPFDCKEGYHLHSLVRFTDLTVRDDNKSAYGKLVDGWRQITADKKARIYSERYKPDKGAHYYVAKYMHKKKSDYDFLNPHLQAETIHDQQEHKGEYMACLQERVKEREELKRKADWRRVKVLQLQEQGIYAGKPEKDKEVYANTDITYDRWEEQEYKNDLPGYIGKKKLLPTGKHIFEAKFTIRPV